jgi:hypothetical protein
MYCDITQLSLPRAAWTVVSKIQTFCTERFRNSILKIKDITSKLSKGKIHIQATPIMVRACCEFLILKSSNYKILTPGFCVWKPKYWLEFFLASLGPQPIPRYTVRHPCSSPNSTTHPSVRSQYHVTPYGTPAALQTQPSARCSPAVTLTVQSQYITQCSDVLPLLTTQISPLCATLPSFPKSHLHSNLTLPETKRTVYQPLEPKYSNLFPASKRILSSPITFPFTSFPTALPS